MPSKHSGTASSIHLAPAPSESAGPDLVFGLAFLHGRGPRHRPRAHQALLRRDGYRPSTTTSSAIERTVRGKTVTIVERRPPWDRGDDEWTSQEIARLKYDAERTDWTLYWSDRNGRFHLYDLIEPGTVASLLDEVEQDPTCIFWG